MDAGDVSQEGFLPKKKKKTDEESEKRRKKITQGSLMKAIIRAGEGTEKPVEEDQVIFHCTTRTLDGVIVDSTRIEHGGKGYPSRLVMGKSKMILGFLEGIPTMLIGEIAMACGTISVNERLDLIDEKIYSVSVDFNKLHYEFKMRPELHYAEVDCPVTAPDTIPKDDELHFEIEMLDFHKSKVVSEDLGVTKKIIIEGQGWETPRELYEVQAWISAKSTDGKMVLSHAQEPYNFTFGKSELPKGLEMGIATMTHGEKAAIYVTKTYLTPSPIMPSLETYEEVQFVVELVHFIQVRDMLGDGRLIKRRVVDGRGEFPMDCPLQDSLLRVHYKGMLLNEEKTLFYDTRTDNNGEPLEFSSGEGLVPEGLEMCVRLMLPGEIAIVTCPPDYAYDKFARPPNVPEGAHVQWEIELLGFEMPKDWTGLNFQEIMDDAEKIKNTGNRLFKEGKFELAKAKYEKVLREYNHVNPQDDEEGKIFLNSRNSLHLNVAACYQKMGEHRKSVDTCNKVLDANPVHVKALYRRGMAYMLVGDFDEARKDFEKMITVDRNSERDASAALLKLKQKEQEVEKTQRKQFKGLFDKKPGEISEVGDSVDIKSPRDAEPDEVANSSEERSTRSDQNGDDTERVLEPERMGFLGWLWPSGNRILTALGLNRCSIL